MTHPLQVETSKHVQMIAATQQVGVILTVINQPETIFFSFVIVWNGATLWEVNFPSLFLFFSTQKKVGISINDTLCSLNKQKFLFACRCASFSFELVIDVRWDKDDSPTNRVHCIISRQYERFFSFSFRSTRQKIKWWWSSQTVEPIRENGIRKEGKRYVRSHGLLGRRVPPDWRETILLLSSFKHRQASSARLFAAGKRGWGGGGVSATRSTLLH